jgi:hypothetical protein
VTAAFIKASALLSGLLILISSCTGTSVADSALQQTPDIEVGVAIKSVDAALANYSDPGAMSVVVLYGTDTRYYGLIRGWLLQRISGLESRMSGEASAAQQQELTFLRAALRRIDLE